MKILYLASATFPSEKSHSLSIIRVCQAFHNAGHDVTLSGRSPESRYEPEDPIAFYGLKGGFSVITHKVSNLLKLRFFRALLIDGLVSAWKTRKLLSQLKPDIIYSRLTLAELVFVPSTIPVIYEMHSLGPLGQKFNRRWAFILLTKIKNFKKIIVTTKVLAEILERRFPEIEITLAPLSADLPVEISEIDLNDFRKNNLKGNGAPFHVGYTGYLDTQGLRGTDIIVKCAAELPNVAFHIVGGESKIVDYWREYSEKYNSNKNIFFYGYRNPKEMPYFLNCFDVVLAPLQFRPSSRAPTGENMSPLKLPQYMSYGKAIVASDIPAHREYLTPNETASLVTHDSIEEWVKAINLLLQNPEIRENMRQKVIDNYRSTFTHEKRVRQILSGSSF
jgi:glycosyltransferase involved in cell wall biosynthesis